MARKPDVLPWSPQGALTVAERIRAFAQRISQDRETIHAIARAVNVMRHLPDVLEVAVEMMDEDAEESAEARRAVRAVLPGLRKEAALIEHEGDAGNPVVYRLGSVALWSAGEAFVTDLLIDWLTHVPEAIQAGPAVSISVKLPELPGDPQELRRSILRRAIDNAAGVSRPDREAYMTPLHVRLGAFGLLAKTDREARKDLFELWQVRNAIVHNSGLADRHLAQHCSWLIAREGEEIPVIKERFENYALSLRNLAESTARHLTSAIEAAKEAVREREQ